MRRRRPAANDERARERGEEVSNRAGREERECVELCRVVLLAKVERLSSLFALYSSRDIFGF